MVLFDFDLSYMVMLGAVAVIGSTWLFSKLSPCLLLDDDDAAVCSIADLTYVFCYGTSDVGGGYVQQTQAVS